MNKSILALGFAATLGIASCTKKPVENTTPAPKTSNEMHFMFENSFGNEELVLNTGSYKNAQNEQITITEFNYWITNIKLVRTDGSEYVEPESYRLLWGNKLSSHHFHVANVPAGTYKAVKFMIGVDVPRNTTGAQTGDLDPVNCKGMYWDWNTGYIQAKMEGTSEQSSAADKRIMYHIGGVQKDKETPRNVELAFSQNIVVGDKAGSLKIKTDAAKWFTGKNAISTATDPRSTHSGGELVIKIADNLPGMFSITSAGNE